MKQTCKTENSRSHTGAFPKDAFREQVATRFAGSPVSLRPLGGKLAEQLRRTSTYKKAQCLFVSFHPLLNQVCLNALADNKALVLPSPKLQAGFRWLTSLSIPVHKRTAAIRQLQGKDAPTPKISYETGPALKIDLLVCASVTAGFNGSRMGDGEGHFDLQYAVLDTLGWLSTSSVAVITLLPEEDCICDTPMEKTDIFAHQLVTPTRHLKTCYEERQIGIILRNEVSDKQMKRNDALYFLNRMGRL